MKTLIFILPLAVISTLSWAQGTGKGNSVSANEYYQKYPQADRVTINPDGSKSYHYNSSSRQGSITVYGNTQNTVQGNPNFGGNQNHSQNSVAPYIPPTYNTDDVSTKECESEFKKLLPNDDQKKFKKACLNSSNVRRTISDKVQSGSWGVKKDDYLKCLDINKSLKNPDEIYVQDCADDYRFSKYIKPEFAACIGTMSTEFGIKAAFEECADSTFIQDYKSVEFAQCKAKMIELSQSNDKILSKCRNYTDRNRIISKGFARCQGLLLANKGDSQHVMNFCFQDSILNNLSRPEFSSCQQSMSQITKNPFITLGMCSNTEALDGIRNNPKCYEEAVKATYKYYIFYAAFSNSWYSLDKNYFYYLARDCRGDKGQTNIQANSYLKFIKDINIHTQETLNFPDKNREHVPVGGISALAYDNKSEILYMLSDETRLSTQLPPRMYTYELNSRLELKDSKILSFSFGQGQEPDIDPEGLVRLQSGEFIVASEVGKNQAEQTDNKITNITNINVFDSSAQYLDSISLPNSFKTKWVRHEIKSQHQNQQGSKTDSGEFVKVGWFGKSDKKDKDDKPVIKYITKHEGGLEFNKSLESLSVSPDESTLFIANESALVQDLNVKGKCHPTRKSKKSSKDSNKSDDNSLNDNKASNGQEGQSQNTNNNQNGNHFGPDWNGSSSYQPCGKVVRIARYTKNDKSKPLYLPADEFKYELEPEVENGIVEILALSPTSVLTLERSWDSVKQKVTSRIFKVGLTVNSQIPAGAGEKEMNEIPGLVKKLILDLDSITPQLSPGFRVLDNLEGMAFGPTLSNGNKTLLLVSDNNFSNKQRTALLFFEILPDLTNPSK